MTLKQFLYLVVSIPSGFLVFKLFPIPFINILLGLITAGIGGALAFVPINDRPMDVWIKNFVRRLFSATQYIYHKENPQLYYFQKLFFVADPHKVVAHIESQEKLNEYLAKTQVAPKVQAFDPVRKSLIGRILHEPPPPPPVPKPVVSAPVQASQTNAPPFPAQGAAPAPSTLKKPTLVGVVKNNRQIPLPGVLIYIKDESGRPVRLLKTNPHGVFATYSSINPGDYLFELKDPKGAFLFDTMKMKVDPANHPHLEFYSKELL